MDRISGIRTDIKFSNRWSVRPHIWPDIWIFGQISGIRQVKSLHSGITGYPDIMFSLLRSAIIIRLCHILIIILITPLRYSAICLHIAILYCSYCLLFVRFIFTRQKREQKRINPLYAITMNNNFFRLKLTQIGRIWSQISDRISDRRTGRMQNSIFLRISTFKKLGNPVYR